METYEEAVSLVGGEFSSLPEDDEDQDIDDTPPIFKFDPSAYPSEIEYTRAIIKHVRKAHWIDDRLENARRESISRNFTTTNVFPKCMQTPLVSSSDSAPYFVKAIVPICKATYSEVFSVENPCQKPKFMLQAENYLQDQIIFGVITKGSNSGQIPPVQICEQNHEAGSQFYNYHFGGRDVVKTFAELAAELNKNYQTTFSFEDVLSNGATRPIDHLSVMNALRCKEFEAKYLEDHDKQEPEKLEIRLADLGVSMSEIIQFNQLLFNQLSNRKEHFLKFENQCAKNYLIVPLSKFGSSSLLQYRVDPTLIKAMTDTSNWVSLQDYIDVVKH